MSQSWNWETPEHFKVERKRHTESAKVCDIPKMAQQNHTASTVRKLERDKGKRNKSSHTNEKEEMGGVRQTQFGASTKVHGSA
jgi:hypothetical protein